MRFTKQMVLFAALSMLPFGFGCQTTQPETTAPVMGRLLADKKVDLSGIKVVSNNGTVYLSGLVHSLDARQQAIKLAWEVRGVQSVVNSLEVK